MTITFVSNYINHHQIPFSNAIYEKLGKDYHFIQTMPMEEERIAMGWGLDEGKIPYVHRLYEDEYECRKIIAESDVVLLGWTEREDIEAERLNSGKITIRASERIYKEGQWKAVSPRGLIAKYKQHIKYRKKNICMLCSGAYVASDFHLIGAYPNKMFKWGYFPETRIYPDNVFASMKKDGPLQIVWAARFIDWKHPEYVVKLAKCLKQKGYDFRIHMLGSGELEQEIKQQTEESGLMDKFTFYGYSEPNKVRTVMEKCHIHLFTSDYKEGWGAVLNEGMNSGCVEVASVQAGATPYLIEHGVNGLVYNSYQEMEKLVIYLFEHWEECRKMGYAAYQTIVHEWNAERAAEEFLKFAGYLAEGRIVPAESGLLSPAPVIAPGKMYEVMMKGRMK